MATKHSSDVSYFLWVILPLLFIVSCSTGKNSVITVNTPTVSSEEPDTLTDHTTGVSAGPAFQSLTIGENQPIYSLDPLFATTLSEMRAIQLVYEGLVRFDKQGKITPTVAKTWTVSDQNRHFSFALKGDVYYQDSPVFSSGRGRQLKASDIKKDFERMARADVPSHAAELFMNIRGFEPYYQEQHHVYRSSERQLHGISGIEVPNDSTIVFILV